MPFQRTRPALVLTQEQQIKLETISRSRTEKASRIERANVLLAYARNASISSIARMLSTNRPRIERCIDKALQLGVLAAIDDLPRSGKKERISPEARAWLISLACQKPKDLGYSLELWTTNLLAKHCRGHCSEVGHPSLAKVSRGTISKILRKNAVRPHKITYYLERKDPEFDTKMVQVLHVYKEVRMLREQGSQGDFKVAILSYDAKPGIQAIANIAPDLPPVPGEHPAISRDYEYIRLGTSSLLASIDLLNGRVHGMVTDRHRSAEFVEHLKMLDRRYPDNFTIRIILDNHSSHVSKETRRFLAQFPNRFEFIFTPKHGSWLNLIESLFAKMAKAFLRGLRVQSKEELSARILKWLDEINESPVIFRWKYGLDTISVA
ncbi:MAG TPA: IS630 family transposase [Deltaproteobacteria bacterium]|nr:IS630 family transposase [Deltaproteobacteria bacterium]